MIFGDAAPRTEVDFVNGDGRLEPVLLRPARKPVGVVPFVMIEARDDGAGVGAQLRAEGVGIGFEREDVPARADNFIFVDGVFLELREKNFPDARGAASAHGMDAAVPAVEVANDTDALCAGSPDREVNAPNAFQRYDVSAEFLVSVVMAAFAHEVEIEFAQDHGKGIGIEDFKRVAEVRASLNLVAAGGRRSGLVRWPSGFEEAFRAKFNRVGNFGRSESTAFNHGRFQGDGGFGGPGQKKAHRPVAVDGMRAEQGKRIGVAGGEDGVDLRVEARIARSNRRCVLHGGALLRQVGSLRNLANDGSADELSGNADPRLLNSRALAGKCQPHAGG